MKSTTCHLAAVPTPVIVDPHVTHETQRGDLFIAGEANIWSMVVGLIAEHGYSDEDDEFRSLCLAAAAARIELIHVVATAADDPKQDQWASWERIDPAEADDPHAFLATVWWSPSGDLRDLIQHLADTDKWRPNLASAESLAATSRLRQAAEALHPWDERAARIFLDTPTAGRVPASHAVNTALVDYAKGDLDETPASLVSALVRIKQRYG